MIDRFLNPPAGSFFLLGPRGVGKTTWTRERFPTATVVDLLDPATALELSAYPQRLRDFADVDPEATVVVDEVQRAPELLSVVHQLIEERKQRFVLTGSSARKLRRGGVNLLGGRAAIRHMHPFLAAELRESFVLGDALRTGLVPVVHQADDPRTALPGYVELYLREEVFAEGLVRASGPFRRFLEAAAMSHSTVLNVSALAREAEVNRRTAATHVEILEDLLLAFRLPVFRRRAKRDLVAHAKLYLFDAGVFRALRPRGPLDSDAELAGAALEGLVAQHLRAWCGLASEDVRLHYWRTQRGLEVDFVLYGAGCFAAIEVTRAPKIRPRDLNGLRAFGRDFPEAARMLVYGGREERVRDGIRIVPVRTFLERLRPGARLWD